MIDTDKYEGHTQGPWFPPEKDWQEGLLDNEGRVMALLVYDEVEPQTSDEWYANARLIADVPLILEAYKRLRELIERVAHSEIEHIQMHGLSVVETEHWDELLIAVELLEREEE